MKGLQKSKQTLQRLSPVGAGGGQKLLNAAGLPDPINEGADAEIAAEEGQKKQLQLLEKQKQQEQLALAENTSEVNKRRLMGAKSRAGRSSLIKTSSTGLLS